MDQKQLFLSHLRGTITSLSGLLHVAEDLQGVYDARQYGAGGANALSEVELDEAGLTPNQLQLAIFLLANFKTFMVGGAPAAANYIAIVNEMRSDL